MRSHPLWPCRTSVAPALGLLLFGFAAAAPVQAAQSYRCVIEPAVTVKLGSAVVGLLDRVPVGRGDRVREGQVVAELDRDVEDATLELIRLRSGNTAPAMAARARLALDRKQLERSEELLKRQVAPAEQVDERRAAVEVRRQELRQTELELQILKQEVARAEALVAQRSVTSPIDGVVTDRRLSAGEFVHQEAYILEIAQLDPLHVEVFLPVKLYEQVEVGDLAVVYPQDPVGGSYTATVTVVDRVLDAASGTFGVRLKLPNRDLELPAGIRCDVRFDGLPTEQARNQSGG